MHPQPRQTLAQLFGDEGFVFDDEYAEARHAAVKVFLHRPPAKI